VPLICARQKLPRLYKVHTENNSFHRQKNKHQSDDSLPRSECWRQHFSELPRETLRRVPGEAQIKQLQQTRSILPEEIVKADFAENSFFLSTLPVVLLKVCRKSCQVGSALSSSRKKSRKKYQRFFTAKLFAHLTAGSSRDFSKSCNIAFQSFVLQ
jgi:hypothetical protein